jgi:hypothetical protein
MTEALVTELRKYIEDETAPYMVTEAIILQKLNTTRHYIDSLQIYAEDYGYDGVSKVYKIGYAGIMNLTLKDGDDNAISTSDYSIDVENGIITFDDGYTIPDTVYATFTYCNFFKAVSECWKYMAALARFDGPTKLADEQIPEDKSSRSYCIRKYWDFCQSENIQMER